MKLKIYITILIVGVVAYVVFAANKKAAFAPAADFPRDALVYVQTSDLPAFLKLWDESKLKDKYLESENFAELKNRHLALKLVSRWQEFSDAAGFPIDLETLSTSTETGAAIAVYDIGKLEFVFAAPVSDEVFVATKFIQNEDKFEAETLSDGTTIYSVAVEADRGRQKQTLLFAHVKGRFVLATSERLLTRTLSNISEKSSKDRLSDEPAFKVLSEKIEPHAATIWINQTALNEDYYFKHYWLMRNADELKNIRAGIFDLSIEEGKYVEHRKFLMNESVNSQKISPADANRILESLPENIPFYRLQTATPKTAADAVFNAILARQSEAAKDKKSYYSRYSSYDYDDYNDTNYKYLSDEYDERINEADEAETSDANSETNLKWQTDLQNILRAANPQSVLSLTRPRQLPMPLFAEFQRAVVINLAAPARFNQSEFESALARSAANRATISAANAELNWETKMENGAARRELSLPLLGWEIGYARRGGELIVSNSRDFLTEIMTKQNRPPNENLQSAFDELTVINLDQKENSYDKIFSQLKDEKTTNDFFVGNIGSLLDTFSDARKIEIKTSREKNFMDEDLIIYFVE
ncbi:MAG: hypothetical protein ACR2HG_08085 [Pyrinomonadaceae bacterium]